MNGTFGREPWTRAASGVAYLGTSITETDVRQMQADTLTLKDILVGEKRFIIPPYQRPYVWERAERWLPLWSDIEDTLARLAERRSDAFAKGAPAAPSDEHTAPHFLGAIVLDQLPTPAGEVDRRAVVDGQQRLITTQLLLRGLLDALEQRDAPMNLLSQLSKLTRNDDDVITAPETVYKVWPRRAERTIFAAAMNGQAPLAEHSRFALARTFFAEAAGVWLDAPDGPRDPFADDVISGRIGLLVAAVRGLLKVVVIDLEGLDDAQVIFEVLNARHTPLTAADLLKNLLFLRAENEGLNVEELYEKHWATFDDPWWAEETGTGHAARPRQDFLLGDWVMARTAQPVSVSHLYGAAKTWIAAAGEKIPDVLASIGDYGVAYRRLHGAVSGGVGAEERRAFRTIAVLRVTAANPLLLWLMTRRPDELAAVDRERAIVSVESYLVRRMAAKWQTRAYVSVFVEVLRAAQKAQGAGIADAVIASLHAAPHGYAWPSDADLESSFGHTRAYGQGGLNQARLKLLLGEVDRRLHDLDSKGEDITISYDALTIEHVMPQKWEAHWPLPPNLQSGSADLAAQHRNQHVHRLGNLTLLTSVLNPSVSNGPWAVKRGAIGKHSVLRLNQRIAAQAEWAEHSINERSRWLAAQVAEIWPIPDDGQAAAHTESAPAVEPAPLELLTDDDVDALHQLLFEDAGSLAEDGRGWRRHGEALGFLTGLCDGLVEGAEVDDLAHEAMQRLIGNGLLELAEQPVSTAVVVEAVWVRPPEHG